MVIEVDPRQHDYAIGTNLETDASQLEHLTRPLLAALATLGDLDSTYLTIFDWDRREQEVQFVHSAGEVTVTKGSRLPLPDSASHESLPGVTRSSVDTVQTQPDSQAARHLGLRTYVSVPVMLARHELYGMLCGASREPHPVTERFVSVMEFFAEIVADHVSRTLVAATEERADNAEEELRARGRFLAVAEHELKTPLTAIQGAAEILHDRWADLGAATRNEFLSLVIRSARDLSRRISGLLVEARADVQARELSPVEIDLGGLVHTITRTFDGASADHEVRADVDEGLTTCADPVALDQVLGHLLDNAIKYSPAGGVISIVGHRTSDGVAVAVVDEGVGLPQGIDIFGPFQRGNGSQVGAAPGIGLGLHIVRTLVEAMGGSVAASSDAEGGTRFTLDLPTRNAPSPCPGTPA